MAELHYPKQQIETKNMKRIVSSTGTTSRRILLSMALLLLSAVATWAQSYDVVVAKDGSGNFTTIQEAINSIRDYKPEGRQRILVKNGIYEEKVIVPSYKTNISLIGENQDSVILVWHDHAGMCTESGWGPFTRREEDKAQTDGLNKKGRKIGTFQSYTLRVDGPGFECENMTISNDAMTHWNPQWRHNRQNNAGVGQAVSVHVEADKVVFRNCKLLGFQDTVFTGNEDGREAFYNCYIEGTVDFIFGPATCWFEECEIHAISNGYLTAASTPAHHPFGYVFYHCKVTADPQVTSEWLGRPWRNAAAVTFYECEFPAIINPLGWHNWKDPEREKTARYREYGNYGEGAGTQQRVAWSRTLSNQEAHNVQLSKVFERRGNVWNSNFRPASFYTLHFAFCDEYHDKGTKYQAHTLEPAQVSQHPEQDVEPLFMKFDGVDCTTLVEYLSAAMLGRVYNPTAQDSVMQRFVQALRYRGGKRGNYATRKHYFSDWVRDNEHQGLMTEITSQLPGAKKQKKVINYMSTHTSSYPQLAASTQLTAEIQGVENELSQMTTSYIPKSHIWKLGKQLREGDIVAFVTNTPGLDVSHMGFIWLRDPEYSQPQVLHASSSVGRVLISEESLADYVSHLKNCIGIRIIRLNAE